MMHPQTKQYMATVAYFETCVSIGYYYKNISTSNIILFGRILAEVFGMWMHVMNCTSEAEYRT
jgi:hypothetical protein